MREVGWYKEFVEDFAPDYAAKLPSMRDFISDEPIPHKDVIVAYLRTGELGSVMIGTMRDVFTGELTGISDHDRSDGEYEWDEGLAYYVDRYNLRLPQDFVDHILERSGVLV